MMVSIPVIYADVSTLKLEDVPRGSGSVQPAALVVTRRVHLSPPHLPENGKGYWVLQLHMQLLTPRLNNEPFEAFWYLLVK